MKERGIFMNGPMVRGTLEGYKTMTRRVTWLEHINQAPDHWYIDADGLMADRTTGELMGINEPLSCRPYDIMCPYGQPGDRLWVRETWATSIDCDGQAPRTVPNHGYPYWYQADNSVRYTGAHSGGFAFIARGKWRPSIFMPREASRLLLEITAVRVERVQDISEEDAKAEGMNEEYIRKTFPPSECFRKPTAKEAFRTLWDSINAKRGYGWDANPWVWVVEFKRVNESENEN